MRRPATSEEFADRLRTLQSHGAYAEDPGRHLQGCYADTDAVDSAARRARRR